eukprot:TRINITY_DN13005_c0_g2_i3.p1 TRINITY_DN13005_c0_g2~~TRINITY_DN13005_c0_g2_i3.p1  ORF type:complete len:280 (-),score=39.87 TRINITY_DN13005_c0_g2_i3:83-922(-)
MFFFFLMIRRPPRSTQSRSSAASDVYKRQLLYNLPDDLEDFYVSLILLSNIGSQLMTNNNPRNEPTLCWNSSGFWQGSTHLKGFDIVGVVCPQSTYPHSPRTKAEFKDVERYMTQQAIPSLLLSLHKKGGVYEELQGRPASSSTISRVLQIMMMIVFPIAVIAVLFFLIRLLCRKMGVKGLPLLVFNPKGSDQADSRTVQKKMNAKLESLDRLESWGLRLEDNERSIFNPNQLEDLNLDKIESCHRSLESSKSSIIQPDSATQRELPGHTIFKTNENNL